MKTNQSGRFEIYDAVYTTIDKDRNEPHHEKTCYMPYANNKGADQPAHPRSLISTFAVRCLDSTTSLVATSSIP